MHRAIDLGMEIIADNSTPTLSASGAVGLQTTGLQNLSGI
jgi:hypothetical protein